MHCGSLVSLRIVHCRGMETTYALLDMVDALQPPRIGRCRSHLADAVSVSARSRS